MPSTSPSERALAATVAALSRHRPADDPELLDQRRALVISKVETIVDRLLEGVDLPAVDALGLVARLAVRIATGTREVREPPPLSELLQEALSRVRGTSQPHPVPEGA